MTDQTTTPAELPPVPCDQHEREMCEVMEERDRYHEWADRLAFALGGPAIGEHSSMNNPWQNALDNPLVRPLPDEEQRGELAERLVGRANEQDRCYGGAASVLTDDLRAAAAFLTEGPKG